MGRKMADRTVIKENAEALLDDGLLDEAIVEYRALVALDGDDPCSHFGLGDAYHQNGMLAEALFEIDEAIRLRPGWAFYHNKKSKVLEEKGELSLAVRELETAIGIKPDLEDARKGLKRVKRKMKRRSQD